MDVMVIVYYIDVCCLKSMNSNLLVRIQTCMFEFIQLKQYEFFLLCMNSYVSKSMNSYHLTPWSLINSEHCAFGRARILMFLLNFLDASSELKCLVFVLHTQVEYQRLRGENGAKEKSLCEEATDGSLRQMVEW